MFRYICRETPFPVVNFENVGVKIVCITSMWQMGLIWYDKERYFFQAWSISLTNLVNEKLFQA